MRRVLHHLDSSTVLLIVSKRKYAAYSMGIVEAHRDTCIPNEDEAHVQKVEHSSATPNRRESVMSMAWTQKQHQGFACREY